MAFLLMSNKKHRNVFVFTGTLFLCCIVYAYLIGNKTLNCGFAVNWNYRLNILQISTKSDEPVLAQPGISSQNKDEIHFKQIHNSSTLEGLHNIIWSQIQSLQEDGDCDTKKILHCENVGNFAGYGSMISRFTACIQIAYGLGRIFFIEEKHYNWNRGLFKYLQPESIKCGHLKGTYMNEKSQCNLRDENCYTSEYEPNNTYKVLVYNIHNTFPLPRQTPGSLPEIIKTHLTRLKIPYPSLWLTSRFLGYLVLRPTVEFKETFARIKREIGYSYPVVAVQIRRTDKVANGESKYIKTEAFVNVVKHYYSASKTNITVKNIYVASDDMNIENELKTLLPNDYRVLIQSHSSRAEAVPTDKRVSAHSYESFLLDLYFLAYSNYTICTYSSNIGRLTYLLRRLIYPHNFNSIESLDNPVSFDWNGHGWDHRFYLAKRSNKGKLIKNMLPYERGARIVIAECTNTLAETKGLLCAKNGNTVMYVFESDVILWPGTPVYHFFH